MKQAVRYALCVMALVLSLGGANGYAGDTSFAKPQDRPSSEVGDSPTISPQTISSQTHSSPTNSSQTATKVPSEQEPAGAPSPRSLIADKSMPNKLSGDFPVMSQPDAGTGIIQVTLGLFVVLLIIAAAAWFARRFGHFQATAGGALKIVGGLHLGARERLVVVQVGDQQLLLGISPGRVSTLHVLSNPLEQGDPSLNRGQQRYGTFRDKLNAVLKREGQ